MWQALRTSVKRCVLSNRERERETQKKKMAFYRVMKKKSSRIREAQEYRGVKSLSKELKEALEPVRRNSSEKALRREHAWCACRKPKRPAGWGLGGRRGLGGLMGRGWREADPGGPYGPL